jgi:uncharacterized protein YbgA (DUF1722 family)
MERFRLLPVEEDGRLNDPLLRENFIERVFCLKRYRDFLADDGTIAGLVNFHTEHKLLIMAHHQQIYREMGRLVADPKSYSRKDLFERYETLMEGALTRKANQKTHSNVLIHMLGFLKQHLSGDEKQEMLDKIDEYRQSLVPLIVPITLMQHYVRKYDEPYLKRQYYLHPHPMELQLRNHA